MAIEVELFQERTTPGTVVYVEDEDTPKEDKIVPTLYIRKTAMLDEFGAQSNWPDSILITIESTD